MRCSCDNSSLLYVTEMEIHANHGVKVIYLFYSRVEITSDARRGS